MQKYLSPNKAFLILIVVAIHQLNNDTHHVNSRFHNKYSRLSLSRSRKDPLEHFEISVLRHIRCAELRKVPNKQPNFTNEHVI